MRPKLGHITVGEQYASYDARPLPAALPGFAGAAPGRTGGEAGPWFPVPARAPGLSCCCCPEPFGFWYVFCLFPLSYGLGLLLHPFPYIRILPGGFELILPYFFFGQRLGINDFSPGPKGLALHRLPILIELYMHRLIERF